MLKAVRLKQLRELNALTQEQLAEKARVSRGTVANIEGGAGAYPPTIRKLADALGVAPAKLFEPVKGN